jgi:Ca2+-binding EF-hand superfamily protein
MCRLLLVSVTIGLMCGMATVGSAAEKPKEKPAKNDPVQKILKTFDKNGDGALDAKELTAFVDAIDQRRADAGNKKSGKVAEHLTAESLMKKFDANNDGKLDATELQAMDKEIHAKREAKKNAAN